MANIDERVVSMKFDNRDFEKNVKTSMNTLEKLKQSLTFENVAGAVKTSTNKIVSYFETLHSKCQTIFAKTQQASSTVIDVTGIQKSLDVIQSQTSAFGEYWKKTFSSIVDHVIGEWNKAYTAIVKQPLTDGFQEYELKMGSVQTIMASTGASLEEVTGYLEELNAYADKTIYSFSDMTSNIGKFTNAGVDLKDAVSAIQGVSNVAAVSGAGTQEASRAMYNFAQALSAGYVKLIDWKSIETANMATVEFKNELIKTAEELGTVVREGDKFKSVTTDANGSLSDAFDACQNFNESLTYQWMTTDVLVKTLSKYTDETTELGKKAFAAAQDVKTWSQLIDTLKEALGSGWGKTFELIIGNFNEAKTLFTDINNVLSRIVDKTSDFRNAFVQAWVDNGGRDKLIADINKILVGFEKITDFAMGATETGLKLLLGENYKKIFGDFATGIGVASQSAEDAQKKLMQWQAAYDIWMKGTYGNGQQRKEAIEAIFNDEFASYDAIQDILEGVIDGSVNLSEGLAAVKEEAKKASEEEDKLTASTAKMNNVYGETLTVADKIHLTMDSLRESFSNVASTVKNLFEAGKNIAKILGEVIANKADYAGVADDVSFITSEIKILSEKILEASKRTSEIRNVFTRVFETVNKVYSFFNEVIGTVIYNVKEVFNTVTKNVSVASKIQDTLGSLRGVIEGVVHGISNLAQAAVNAAGVFVDSFLRVFKFDVIASDIKGLIDKFVQWTNKIKDGSKNTDKLRSKFDKFFKALNKIYDVLKGTFAFIFDLVSWIVEKIRAIITAISEWVSNIDQHSPIYRAWNAIYQIIFNLIQMFGNIRTAIKEAFGKKASSALESTKSGLDKIMSTVSNLIKKGLDVVLSVLEKIASIDLSKIDFSWLTNLKFSDGGFFDKLKNIAVNLDNPFTKVGDWISSIFTKENFEKIKNGAIGVGNAILSAIGKLDWTKLWAAASLIIFTVAGVKIIKLIASATGVLDSLKESIESVTKITDGLKEKVEGLFDAVEDKLEESSFETLMATIMAVVAALVVLSNLPVQNVIIAGTVITVILMAIKKIVDAVGEMHKQAAQAASTTGQTSVQKILAKGKALTAQAVKEFGLGIIILGFAAVIYAVGMATAMMSEAKNIGRTLGVISLVLIVISALTVGAQILAKKTGNATISKNVMSLGVVVAAFGFVILEIAAALKIMNGVDFSKTALAAILLVPLIFFAGIAGIIAVVGAFKMNNLKNFKTLAIAAILLSAAIDALIPVIALFGVLQAFHVDINNIADSLLGLMVGIAAWMVAMGGALKMMGTSVDNKKMLMFAASIAIIMGAFSTMAFSGSLANFFNAFIGAEKWYVNVLRVCGGLILLTITIAGCIAIFIALFAALSLIPRLGITPRKIQQYSKSFMMLGAGFALIGVGILAVVAALNLLPGAAVGMIAFGKALEEHGDEIARVATTLAVIIISAFVAGFVMTKAETAWKIFTVVVEVLFILSTFLEGHTDQLVAALSSVIGNLLHIIGGVLGTLASGVVLLVLLVVAQIALALGDNAGNIWEILYTAIGLILATIVHGVLGMTVKAFQDLFGGLIEKISGYAYNAWNESMKTIGELLGKFNYVKKVIEAAFTGDDVNLADYYAEQAKAIKSMEDFMWDPKEVDRLIKGKGDRLDLGDYMDYIVEEQGYSEKLHEHADNIEKEFKDYTKKLNKNAKDYGDAAKDVINDAFGVKILDVDDKNTFRNQIKEENKAVNQNVKAYIHDVTYSAQGVVYANKQLVKAMHDRVMGYEKWYSQDSTSKINSRTGRAYTDQEMSEKYKKYVHDITLEVTKADIQARKDAEKAAEEAEKKSNSLVGVLTNTLDDGTKWITSDGKGDILGNTMAGSTFDIGSIDFVAQARSLTFEDFASQHGEIFDVDMLRADYGVNDDGYLNIDDISNEDFVTMYANPNFELDTDDSDAQEQLLENTKEFEDAGNRLGNALMDSFNGIAVERAYKAGQDIAKEAAKGVTNQSTKNETILSKKAEDTGAAIGEGMRKGYESKQKEIRDEALKNGNLLILQYCKALGIASPSKRMIEIGQYVVDGLLVGMRNRNSNLRRSTLATTNEITNSFNSIKPVITPVFNTDMLDGERTKTATIIDALKSPMDFLISYFNGELEYDPSIRPTMDISDIRTGTGLINNMLAKKTYDIGTEVNATLNAAAFERMDYMEAMKAGYNDGNVLGAINKLNNDINNLNESMSNMTVVMDTGALVGSIAEPVDYALGQRQYMRGRGM